MRFAKAEESERARLMTFVAVPDPPSAGTCSVIESLQVRKPASELGTFQTVTPSTVGVTSGEVTQENVPPMDVEMEIDERPPIEAEQISALVSVSGPLHPNVAESHQPFAAVQPPASFGIAADIPLFGEHEMENPVKDEEMEESFQQEASPNSMAMSDSLNEGQSPKQHIPFISPVHHPNRTSAELQQEIVTPCIEKSETVTPKTTETIGQRRILRAARSRRPSTCCSESTNTAETPSFNWQPVDLPSMTKSCDKARDSLATYTSGSELSVPASFVFSAHRPSETSGGNELELPRSFLKRSSFVSEPEALPNILQNISGEFSLGTQSTSRRRSSCARRRSSKF